jgi:hypothetical protein
MQDLLGSEYLLDVLIYCMSLVILARQTELMLDVVLQRGAF